MDCFAGLREVLMRFGVINEPCRLSGVTLIEREWGCRHDTDDCLGPCCKRS